MSERERERKLKRYIEIERLKNDRLKEIARQRSAFSKVHTDRQVIE